MAQDMSPLLGPDILQKQYELEQNKKIADILMSQGMQQPQGQMVSGRYVAPSFFQYATPLLNAYLGTKMSNEIPKQAADLSTAQNAQIDRMFGIGGATPQQASQAALQGGAMQGSTGPTVANALRMNNVQQGTGSAYPLIGGNAQGTAAVFRTGGPTAYAKALAEQLQLTSDMKNIAAAYPVGSPEYNDAMKKVAFKLGYVNPTVVSEGGALVPAGSNMPSYIAPKGGIQTQISPQGQFTSSVIPGYTNATGQIERAQSYGQGLGKAQTTPAEMIDASGNKVGTTQANVMGLPTEGVDSLPVQQPRTPVVTSLNPIGVEAGKELNTSWIKNTLEPTQAAGNTAQATLDSLNVLRGTNLQTGWGSEVKAAGANMLASLGVKDAEKYATNAQIFTTEVSRRLMDTMAAQKGAQSQSDFENIKKTEAKLANTPQANQFIFDLAEAKAMQDQRKANYFTKAAQIPELRNNLTAITNEWKKVEGSIFDMPSMRKYKVME